VLRCRVSVQELVPTSRTNEPHDIAALRVCVEVCFACARACDTCADKCLEERTDSLTTCIRLSLDCAELCATAGNIASRRAGLVPEILRVTLEACAVASRLCALECEMHAQSNDAFRSCALACRECERVCRDTVATVLKKAASGVVALRP
jgi:hypothetical protein